MPWRMCPFFRFDLQKQRSHNSLGSTSIACFPSELKLSGSNMSKSEGAAFNECKMPNSSWVAQNWWDSFNWLIDYYFFTWKGTGTSPVVATMRPLMRARCCFARNHWAYHPEEWTLKFRFVGVMEGKLKFKNVSYLENDSIGSKDITKNCEQLSPFREKFLKNYRQQSDVNILYQIFILFFVFKVLF